MIAYPDTSFLCALYVTQSNSTDALAQLRKMKDPLHVAAALLYEFRQSVRFQAYLNSKDSSKGYPKKQAQIALDKLRDNIAVGAITVVTADWADVFDRAEKLSAQHTLAHGHRAFDLLHVATALHLGAQNFLSFDHRQRLVAKAEKLNVLP